MKTINFIAGAALASMSLLSLDSCCNKEAEEQAQPQSMIIYEADPLYFAEDSCFDAIAARLPEIKSMGVDVLWLMPIFPPGEERSVGSPYCVKDFKAINPRYGDMQSLKSLIAKAHDDDMKVILDWVANHAAWDNPWVAEHPEWFSEERNETEMPWQDVTVFDYDNTDMRDAMIGSMTYWVKEAGIDGFRCDYVEGVPLDFWTAAIDSIRAIKPDAFMLAEGSLFSAYDAGFDMIYDWQYCLDLQDFYHGKIDFNKLVNLTETRAEKIPEGKHILRYVINHDVIAEHSPVDLYGSNEAVPGAYVLTAFLGQVPMIYSGMEAGFTDHMSFFHGVAQPLTWSADELAKYVAIDRAYAATAATREGQLTIHDSESPAVIYTHTAPDCAHCAAAIAYQQVMVVVNPTGDTVEAVIPEPFQAEVTDLLAEAPATLSATLTLAPYAHAIYAK